MSTQTRAAVLFLGLAAAAAGVLAALPPIAQDEAYHRFVDQRTLWGIANFWNVATNLAFLAAAAWGTRALGRQEAFRWPWERAAYAIFLAGVALTAFGSAWYHLHPDDARLAADRLPMTLAFLPVFCLTMGERVDARAARWLLVPLLAAGAGSVMYWRLSGDLRWYGLVQFVPVAAIPAMLLLFPPRYSHAGWTWAMAGLYLAAKAAELGDRALGAWIATGGHPWKHLLAAAAAACYAEGIARRRLADPQVEIRPQPEALWNSFSKCSSGVCESHRSKKLQGEASGSPSR